MRVSSAACTAVLHPDGRSRCLLLASGAAGALAGATILLSVLPPAVAALPCIAWIAASAAEARRLLRAWRRCDHYVIAADGHIECHPRAGRPRPATVGRGSVFGRRASVVCIDPVAGAGWVECVRRDVQDRQQWRRFRVICRHFAGC